VAEFVGVTTSEAHWGISDSDGAGTGLYQFKTEAGVRVQLHDASFLGIDFRVGPPASLVTSFLYDDPKWTPVEARATPLIAICFEDVHITGWDQDSQGVGEPADALGQVSAFDYYENLGSFDLQTYTLRLQFTARRVEVTLLPGPRP
jgi:hypothetical protein